MRYIFFTTENSISPIAQKLEQEGNEVTVAQIEDLKLTLTSEELKGNTHEEKPNERKRRLSMGNGLVVNQNAVDVIKAMKKLKPADYFITGDTNAAFAFTEQALKMGFTGMLTEEKDRMFEVDREAAKEIVEKNYPALEVMEHKEFKTAQEGVDFLQDTDKTWVLKSLGDSGETIVPKIDDPELASQQLIDVLNRDKKAYEENGFMLEQKVIDGIELTPQAVFLDGTLVFTDLDIETKTMGSHERGPNKGCGTNLIVRTNPKDKLNKMAFPKYVHDLAKSRKGIFIIDAGILFDRNSKRAYFTEFCFQRFGWDAFPTELSMCDSVASYFESIMKGENPLKRRFGAGVRLFNLNQDDERYPEPELSVNWKEEAEKDLYLYDVKKSKGKVVTAGFQQDLGVATGSGDFLMQAIGKCYENANAISLKDMYYKSHEDFVSREYPQSILNRLMFAVSEGLIEDNGIMQEILSMGDQGDGSQGVDTMLVTKMIGDYAKKVDVSHKEQMQAIRDNHEGQISKIKGLIQSILEE